MEKTPVQKINECKAYVIKNCGLDIDDCFDFDFFRCLFFYCAMNYGSMYDPLFEIKCSIENDFLFKLGALDSEEKFENELNDDENFQLIAIWDLIEMHFA